MGAPLSIIGALVALTFLYFFFGGARAKVLLHGNKLPGTPVTDPQKTFRLFRACQIQFFLDLALCVLKNPSFPALLILKIIGVLDHHHGPYKKK